ncbi:MAG: Flp pilus assembly complex ATPase component TadA [Alphaproteobacteria bacterium]|nr:Flp pilus assembly complex ATPase component TadA [Alphaproteobacteria bacterium]
MATNTSEKPGASLEMFGFSGPPAPAPLLGRRLVELGILSEDQLKAALEAQSRSPHRMLGSILTEKGLLSDESLAGVLGDPSLAPPFDPRTILLDPQAVNLLPQDVAASHKVLAISSGGGAIIIAASEGSTANFAEELKRYLPHGARIEPRFWPEEALASAISSVYGNPLALKSVIQELARIAQGPPSARPSRLEDWRNPIVRFVNAALLEAIRLGASHIHMEPQRDHMRFALRVGGALQSVLEVPIFAWPDTAARLARLGGWSEACEAMLGRGKVKGAPPPAVAEGLIPLKLGTRTIDARTHAVLTEAGIAVTVLLVETRGSPADLGRLGLTESNEAGLVATARRPGGMLLIAGPARSGRSTTLYALLDRIRASDTTILAIDDRAEVVVEGVRQMRHQSGDTKGALVLAEAALRQDPDVLVFGSIDAPELAEAAFRAAVAGLKVIATFTARDAMAALARLQAFGIAPELIAGTMSGVYAQRLLRRLCPVCKTSRPASGSDLLEAGLAPGSVATLTEAKGCPTCRETGYKGRLVLSELLVVDGELEDLIANRAPRLELLDFARRRGFAPIAEDGLLRLSKGEVTLADLARLVDLSAVREG